MTIGEIRTIDQVLRQIEIERTVGSRFPVRLIFVEHLGQYMDLVSQLVGVCDIKLNLADEDICTGADIYPNFVKLQDKILWHNDKHILLLSMGEYLRFRIKRECIPSEAKFPSLWQLQQDSASRTRVFIPMFACKDLFERVVPQIDDRRQEGFIWEIGSSANAIQSFSVSVFSPTFSNVMSKQINGLREWLTRWQDEYSNTEQINIITALYPNVEKTNGRVNVTVIDNAFDYMCSLLSDGHRLKREWASDAIWSELIPRITYGQKIDTVIKSILNILTFSSIAVISMWDTYSMLQRQLVWIWYQLNDSDDYCSYVFRHTYSIDAVKNNLRDEIIRFTHKSEWIDERYQLLMVLNGVNFNDEYFELLDSLPLPEIRLHLLTYKTHEECTYAIKTISHWLRQGASIQGVLEAIKGRFSLLEQYISGDITTSDELTEYFSWYRYNKLINRMPQALPPSINLEAYPSRYSLLDQYNGKDCFVLWVDGMGVEWLPLLQKQISDNLSAGTLSVEVATALLPTDTEYNKQWNDFDNPYNKWNRLDELAHKGSPDDKDYYSCINYQFSVIADVAQEALSMLNEHNYVVITADHGSSRIAALSFHDAPGIPAPKKAIVRSYGRFCELNEPVAVTDMLPCVQLVKREYREYMVMKTYDHYAVSGNAAGGNDDDKAISGEIHGGMTPEEYLVPVIILKRNVPLNALDYSLKSNTVFRNKETTTIELHFNRDVSTLEATAGSIKGVCTQESLQNWTVSFNGLDIGEYVLEIIANKRLIVNNERISIKSKGISINYDPFGGF